jgi:hypothetical protein
MKRCHRVLLGALLLAAIAATPGLAQDKVATITFGRDPEPPYCVANPGGQVQIFGSSDFCVAEFIG